MISPIKGILGHPSEPTHEVLAQLDGFADSDPEPVIRKWVRQLRKSRDPGLRVVLSRPDTGLFVMFRTSTDEFGQSAVWAMVPGNRMRQQYELPQLDAEDKAEMRHCGWRGPGRTISAWWVIQMSTRTEIDTALEELLFGPTLWDDRDKLFAQVHTEIWDVSDIHDYVVAYPPLSFFLGATYGFTMNEMVQAGR
ncbi:hypothetical protein [Cellulomonas sp. Leaf334]|uniref:hypothetical protein n=1 Tax=Cellulomonas sp. Leaf334 TaxID=1736339 RepID=UPI0006F3FE10|nr:hypothetical protein [Cellulomonas sp. Leaf334]KQR10447.1 hypothetical protein ASF78_17325 [Cellulomonas sp. Leaf334]